MHGPLLPVGRFSLVSTKFFFSLNSQYFPSAGWLRVSSFIKVPYSHTKVFSPIIEWHWQYKSDSASKLPPYGEILSVCTGGATALALNEQFGPKSSKKPNLMVKIKSCNYQVLSEMWASECAGMFIWPFVTHETRRTLIKSRKQSREPVSLQAQWNANFRYNFARDLYLNSEKKKMYPLMYPQ